MGQSLSRSKGLWSAQRAVLEQHCTFWQRGKPSLELLEPWQEHWSSAVPGCPPARDGSHLWGCCRAGWRHGPAGPADRGLVWPGWPGAAGEQEYCPGITWLWSGSSVVQCSHERSCCSFYMLKQSHSHSHSMLAQEVQGWEGPVALPAALWLPLQPRA